MPILYQRSLGFIACLAMLASLALARIPLSSERWVLLTLLALSGLFLILWGNRKGFYSGVLGWGLWLHFGVWLPFFWLSFATSDGFEFGHLFKASITAAILAWYSIQAFWLETLVSGVVLMFILAAYKSVIRGL